MEAAIATSGTYSFNPSVAETIVEAFSRCEKPASELTREMMFEARRSVNYELVKWSNRGINLWAVDLQSIPILAGVGVYTGTPQGVPPETVAVLDCYWSQRNGFGAGVNNDRLMLPMSRDEYAEYPNKLAQGIPTRYWFERTIPPQMVIYQTPSTGQDSTTANTPYFIDYYRLRRLQDAAPTTGQTADVEYRFLDALAAGLSLRLCLKYKPEKYQILKAEAEESWAFAASANRDDSPITVSPQIQRYWR